MGVFSQVLMTVDFDRTLTGPDGKIPQANLKAIDRFMHDGGAFTVNTGRSCPASRSTRRFFCITEAWRMTGRRKK